MSQQIHNDARTRALLRMHAASYPHLQAEDVFKYLFHSACGCEHLIASEQRALDYIIQESLTLPPEPTPRVEPLDGDYCRVHLGVLRDGLRPGTLARLFCLSAKAEQDGPMRLLDMLEVARDMVRDGDLPLDQEEFACKLERWRDAGLPAIHHSEAFRAAYHPAYRVIATKYADILPLLCQIDKQITKQPYSVIVTIEGGSASGKTTLAALLQEIYGCNVFHTDDFFLQPHQRTQERLAEIGGNLDRERFIDDVLRSVCMQERVCYRRFDCSTQTLGELITLPHTDLTVIEGAYSMHPAFGQYYHLSVFLDIAPDLQRQRITRRNPPALAKRFFDEWIPMENKYFAGMAIKHKADLVLHVSDR